MFKKLRLAFHKYPDIVSVDEKNIALELKLENFMTHWKNRLKAFSIHLIISAAVISIFMLIVAKFWFPGPLFDLENVWQGLKILILVTLVLGPLLTLLVFVPGKKHLMLDLVVIVACQMGALIYGGFVIYGQRPAVFVFVVDRFEILPASEAVIADIPMQRFDESDKSFPLITYALPAQSVEERNHYVLNKVDFKRIGERHYPIKDYLDKVAEKSLDINKITPINERSQSPLKSLDKDSLMKDNLYLLPLQATTGAAILVAIDASTGQVIQLLDIVIWAEYNKKQKAGAKGL